MGEMGDGGDFLRQVEEFSEFGSTTRVDEKRGIPYFTNEFWTSRQRQAHRIHEISYRACFKPQLPRFFIERLTKPGDVVYDPFMGRGTTPVEAALLGRRPFGSDINPLSVAFAAPRVNAPDIGEVERRLAQIPWGGFREFYCKELLAFYHPKTLAKIEGLREWIGYRLAAHGLDGVDQWIRMVALNRLTGHSSGFFSVYTLPPNQAASIQSQLKINEKRRQAPPDRDVPSIIFKKTKSLLADGAPRVSDAVFLTRYSCCVPEIPSGSVDLTVTSPPFLDVVNYEADNWLRCWFMGLDSKMVDISLYRNIEAWQDFIAKTLAELARVTRSGGYVAFEVGEVRNATVRLEENVIAAAQGLPLEGVGVLINEQKFTKTSNCWGVANNQGGTNSNRVVVFRRT